MDARTDYITGGAAQEPAWKAALKSMKETLDKLADYVDGIAKEDAETIKLSGFTPTNSTAKKEPTHVPDQPQTILEDKETVEGELILECETYGGGVSYGCILTEDGPLPEGVSLNRGGQLKIPPSLITIIQSVSHKRKKVFTDLKSGHRYYAYFYVTNAIGVSTLSVPKALTCR